MERVVVNEKGRPSGLRTWLRTGLATFAGAGFLVGSFAYLADHGNQVRYRILSERGVAGTATVTRSEPDNHNTIYVEYAVGTQEFYESHSALPPNPEAEQLHPGDTVRIVYDPVDPRVSCSCEPKAMKSPLGELGTAVFVGVSLGGSVAIPLTVYFVRRRESARSSTAQALGWAPPSSPR